MIAAMLKSFKPRMAPRIVRRRAWGSGTFALCPAMIAKIGAPTDYSLNFCNRVSPSLTRSPAAQSR